MKFIQLHEIYHDTHAHGYLTRPVACNIDEISDVRQGEHPDYYSHQDCSVISLKNGRVYVVKENYHEIITKIVQLSKEK